VAGLRLQLPALSFAVLTHTPLKNRAMGVALALGGRQSMKIPNNQLIVESSGRIDFGKKARGW
jgi:hypothetical protein